MPRQFLLVSENVRTRCDEVVNEIRISVEPEALSEARFVLRETAGRRFFVSGLDMKSLQDIIAAITYVLGDGPQAHPAPDGVEHLAHDEGGK